MKKNEQDLGLFSALVIALIWIVLVMSVGMLCGAERAIGGEALRGQTDADVRLFIQEPTVQTANGTITPQSRGSATIFYSDGCHSLVLTADHNVRDAIAVYVITNDGDRYPATILARDARLDLCIVRIGLTNSLYRPIAKTVDPNGRFWVTGYPGMGERYVSKYVTGSSDKYQDSIVFPVPVVQGTSGGGIIDERGHLVSVVSASEGGETFAADPKQLRAFVFASSKQYTQYRSSGCGSCSTGSCRQQPQIYSTQPQPQPQPNYTRPVVRDPRPIPASVPTPKPVPQGPSRSEKLQAEVLKNREAINVLVNRFENLPAQQGLPGKQGPRGEAGPLGKTGPPGKFDTSSFATHEEVTNVELQGTKGRSSLLKIMKTIAGKTAKSGVSAAGSALTLGNLAGLVGLGGFAVGGPVGLGLWLAKRRLSRRLKGRLGGGDGVPFLKSNIPQQVIPQIMGTTPQMQYLQPPTLAIPIPPVADVIEWRPKTTTITETTEQIPHRAQTPIQIPA